MGIVYRALDLKLNREVALKVLPPELVSNPERKRRFIQEAQAAAALQPPHIAVIHEIDEAEGVTFIAMELIRGKKLSEMLSGSRLSVSRALELGVQVADGLAGAHEKGVIHRDLKPANIMVGEDGHAKSRANSRGLPFARGCVGAPRRLDGRRLPSHPAFRGDRARRRLSVPFSGRDVLAKSGASISPASSRGIAASASNGMRPNRARLPLTAPDFARRFSTPSGASMTFRSFPSTASI
jgi:serine/threonine protein kinase